MKLIESANELRKIHDFLFVGEKGAPLVAQISVSFWTERKTEGMTGKICTVLPSNVVNAATKLPLTTQHAKTVDIDVMFVINELLVFKLTNVELKPYPMTVGQLFLRGIKELEGETVEIPQNEDGEIIGYVTHKFGNQKIGNTYKISKLGDTYAIDKQLGKGKEQGMHSNSSRMKAVIKVFEEHLKAGTLQTEFRN